MKTYKAKFDAFKTIDVATNGIENQETKCKAMDKFIFDFAGVITSEPLKGFNAYTENGELYVSIFGRMTLIGVI